jgi:hypothetical protein
MAHSYTSHLQVVAEERKDIDAPTGKKRMRNKGKIIKT